jgi:double-GTPase-like protein
MATFGTRRRCPYCGETIELGACPIVATNFEGAELVGAGGPVAGSIVLHSRAKPARRLERTGWPVLLEAPQGEVKQQPGHRTPSRLEKMLGADPGNACGAGKGARKDLPPLFEVAAREDLPARACPNCEYPLPQSIDERPAVVIGVVGVNAVGKTHLMAASLGQAYRQGALSAIGVTEFVPDELTASRFLDEYYRPLFQEGQLLAGTYVKKEARFAPLVFNVTMRGFGFSLVLHDIAGESLASVHQRSAQAQFLHGAKGIIFVVDPRDIDGLRDEFPSWMLEDDALGWDQGALLSACLRSDGPLDSGSPVPVAVTVAKADLLPEVTGEELSFLEPAPKAEGEDAFAARVKAASRGVAEFLERHEAYTILGPAREYERRLAEASTGSRMALTYHAVSALGSAPDRSEQLSTKVRPINCTDPLAAILMQVGSPA